MLNVSPRPDADMHAALKLAPEIWREIGRRLANRDMAQLIQTSKLHCGINRPILYRKVVLIRCFDEATMATLKLLSTDADLARCVREIVLISHPDVQFSLRWEQPLHKLFLNLKSLTALTVNEHGNSLGGILGTQPFAELFGRNGRHGIILKELHWHRQLDFVPRGGAQFYQGSGWDMWSIIKASQEHLEILDLPKYLPSYRDIGGGSFWKLRFPKMREMQVVNWGDGIFPDRLDATEFLLFHAQNRLVYTVQMHGEPLDLSFTTEDQGGAPYLALQTLAKIPTDVMLNLVDKHMDHMRLSLRTLKLDPTLAELTSGSESGLQRINRFRKLVEAIRGLRGAASGPVFHLDRLEVELVDGSQKADEDEDFWKDVKSTDVTSLIDSFKDLCGVDITIWAGCTPPIPIEASDLAVALSAYPKLRKLTIDQHVIPDSVFIDDYALTVATRLPNLQRLTIRPTRNSTCKFPVNESSLVECASPKLISGRSRLHGNLCLKFGTNEGQPVIITSRFSEEKLC